MKLRLTTLCLAMGGLLGAGEASAVTREITARYDAQLDTGSNRFTDTTPWGAGVGCQGITSFCQGRNFILAWWPGIAVGAVNIGDRFPEWIISNPERQLTITGEGLAYELAFQFGAISTVFRVDGTMPFTANVNDFDNLATPFGACGGGVAAEFTARVDLIAGWVLPKGNGSCHAVSRVSIPAAEGALWYVGLGYNMTPPNPSAMHSGTYTGTLRYRFGFGNGPGDFVFPHAPTNGSEDLILNFTLTVNHELKVDFPGTAAGSPVVAYLEPPGGWDAWQGRGAPPQLQREVPFRISTTGPLKVSLQCQHLAGTQCGIQDSASPTVEPIEVALTIPGMDVIGGGQVLKVPLDTLNPVRTMPSRTVHGERAALHFRTDAAATARIAATAGARYEGTVTVVYDATP